MYPTCYINVSNDILNNISKTLFKNILRRKQLCKCICIFNYFGCSRVSRNQSYQEIWTEFVTSAFAKRLLSIYHAKQHEILYSPFNLRKIKGFKSCDNLFLIRLIPQIEHVRFEFFVDTTDLAVGLASGFGVLVILIVVGVILLKR